MSQLDLFGRGERPEQAVRLASKLRTLADRGVFIGTSSWKYEGWLGSIYSPERYQTRGKFSLRKFEAECLAEYAETVPVMILATYGFERRGVWYRIETGIRGILTPDENGIAVCYMVCQEASHYYRNMTGAYRMPVLIDQTI